MFNAQRRLVQTLGCPAGPFGGDPRTGRWAIPVPPRDIRSLATASSITVLVASIVAFVQIRRGTARVEATSVELNVLRGVASVLAVLVVVSAVVTLAARDTVEEADRVDAIEVLMEKTEFRTAELDAKAGETLHLVIKNNDLYIHSFTILELGVDVMVGPRGEKAVSLSPNKTGTFEYECIIPGHESMTGTLTVS